MDRRLVPALGLLLVASFYSFVSGPSGTTGTPSGEQHGATAKGTSARSTTAQPQPKSQLSAADTTKLIPRAELGPWQASCEFFLNQLDRSPAVPINLAAPLQEQRTGVEYHPFVKLPGQPDTAANNHPARPSDEELLAGRWCVNQNIPVQFLIATLPDPVNTHLALDFDRRIEAMQWAAQDSGYLVDSYWIPWQPGGIQEYDDPETQRLATTLRLMRESQPGLQIFRQVGGEDEVTGALFVFLVGETPTKGTNKPQLLNALDYIEQVWRASGQKGPPSEIPLLGPSFSGSVNSLVEVLNGPDYKNTRFHIVPSSATDKGSLDLLSNKFSGFEAIMHDDQTALDRFFRSYVRDQLHLRWSEIALLSESGTAYGGGLSKASPQERQKEDERDWNGDTGILKIRFPRDVAHLRTAYPDQPYPSAGGPNTPTVPVMGLPLDLKQLLGSDQDLPPFSMSELPLSQESVLLSIASTLRQRRIKLAGIQATDIFDVLFLARFLRQVCPDIRLFVIGSDRLLVRAAESYPLEGTLVLTTYPLIADNSLWTGFPKLKQSCAASDSHFANYEAEGTYNAFLALLGNRQCLRDYASPAGEKMDGPPDEPPVWVTVVGHKGFSPVAILRPIPAPDAPSKILAANGPKGARSFPFAKGPDVTSERFRYDFPSAAYLLLCGLLTVFAFGPAFAGWFKPACPHGYLIGMREFFRITGTQNPQPGLNCQKAFFHATALLILLVVEFITFWPLWVGVRQWRDWLYWLFCLLTVVATLGTIFWVVQAFREVLKAPRGPDEKLFNQPHKLMWASTSAAVVFLVYWALLGTQGANGELTGSFFLYRSPQFSSGVSPLVPCFLLLVALYLWCWTQFRCITDGQWRTPALPTEPLDETYGSGLKDCKRYLYDQLGAIFPESRLFWFVFLSVMASPLLLRAWGHVASLEPSPYPRLRFLSYDLAYLLLLVLLYVFIFANWIRMLSVWAALRAILVDLERPMLRRAFDRLPKGLYSLAVLWNPGAKRSYARLLRSVECLQELSQDCGPADARKLGAFCADLRGHLQALSSRPALDGDLAEQVKLLEGTLLQASDYVLETLLIPHWEQTGSSDSLDRQDNIGATSELSKERYLLQTKEPHDPPDYIVLAEEFVALRFVYLIRYVFLQLGNLLLFLVTAFVLSVASLRSYPFLSHRTIGWTLTLIAGVLGSGVVTVFAQMDRDAILSRLSNTEPGKLGREFYFRVISYGALPLLTVLASQFPSIGKFLFSWVQPGLEAMK